MRKSGDYASTCSTPPNTEFIFELVFQEGYYCFKFGPAGLFVYLFLMLICLFARNAFHAEMLN